MKNNKLNLQLFAGDDEVVQKILGGIIYQYCS